MGPEDLPRYDDLLWPTLKAVDALGGSGTISEIDDRVLADMALPEDALSVVYEKSGASIVPDRISWARSYLKMAGLLGSGGRGVWVVTEAGRNQLSEGSEQAVRRLVSDAYNDRAQVYRERAAAKANASLERAADDRVDTVVEAEAGRGYAA